MLPVARRLEVRQREHAQHNHQSPGEKRLPSRKNAIRLNNHSENSRANTWKDAESEPVRQDRQQRKLQRKKADIQGPESDCTRPAHSKQFRDRRIKEHVGRRHVSGEPGWKRRVRIAEGPPLCHAYGYPRHFSGLHQIVSCGTPLRRKSIDHKAQAKNDDREVHRGKRAHHVAQRSLLRGIATQSHALQSRKALTNAQLAPLNTSRNGTGQTSWYVTRHKFGFALVGLRRENPQALLSA